MREPFGLEEDKSVLTLTDWEKHFPGLVAGFTVRLGGESEQPYGSFNMGLHVGDEASRVVANRKKLAEQVGMPFDAWTCADQVHGNRVCQVSAGGAGKESLDDVIAATDGLFTREKGVLLTSFYADCVPLFFWTRQQGRLVWLTQAGRAQWDVLPRKWSSRCKRIAGRSQRTFA